MSIRTCSKCGCKTEDLKCPICGGFTGYEASSLHDEKLEKMFNNGYHDDFREGRKTGEYCDRELEKNINGGDHYSSNNSQSWRTSPDGTIKVNINSAKDYPKTLAYTKTNVFVPPKNNEEPNLRKKRKLFKFLFILFFLLPTIINLIIGFLGMILGSNA